MATGLLTLTDAYVYGTDITSATFVSFSYSSIALSFNIKSPNIASVGGGLNSDGSVNAAGEIQFIGKGSTAFDALPDLFHVTGGGFITDGTSYTFTNRTPPSAVPEPSTWAMMLVGFAGLGYVSRASRKSATLAA